jgi:hypothetical protein
VYERESWEFTHRIAGAWTLQREMIRRDTHAAVQAWAAETKTELPQFEPRDVVIQSRCD